MVYRQRTVVRDTLGVWLGPCAVDACGLITGVTGCGVRTAQLTCEFTDPSVISVTVFVEPWTCRVEVVDIELVVVQECRDG